MNNPFEEIFKRLDSIEKMISPRMVSSTQTNENSQNQPSPLVKISVASQITGYSVNYLYHLASKGAIPCVRRGRSLRFNIEDLEQWLNEQYVSGSNNCSDERKKDYE